MSTLAASTIVRILVSSLAWAAVVTGSAAISLFLGRDWVAQGRSIELLAIIFTGGLLGYMMSRLLLTWLPERWQPTRRFASAFILIGAATIGITAFIFALQFRAYFAQWHDDEWSRRYMFETVFTILSAMYQFLVLGLRLYMPLGLIGLLAVSYGYAKRRI